VRRPSPTLVREIGERLSETVDSVSPPALVAAIHRETGCSRATAYRAVRGFLAQLDSRYGVPSRGSWATARRAGCLADLNSGGHQGPSSDATSRLRTATRTHPITGTPESHARLETTEIYTQVANPELVKAIRRLRITGPDSGPPPFVDSLVQPK